VQPGRYLENVDFLGKAITVRSTEPNDAAIVAGTIIDANNAGSTVTFANGEGSGSVLRGLTITGGAGTIEDVILWGGGIYCNLASPAIIGNVVTGNHGEESATTYGGGIACLNSIALIEGNIITRNTASVAGGIAVLGGDTETYSNLITENSALIIGGAYIVGGKLANNTLQGNDASSAANVYVAGPAEIVNNIVVYGDSDEGGGIWVSNNNGLLLGHNNVWGNSGGNYYGVPDQTGINGNISEDPLFVTAENYHLQGVSPCVNGGDPAIVFDSNSSDIDGEERVYGGRVDIGADEYIGPMLPISDAGADQHFSSRTLPAKVMLDGSGSFDPNGAGLTYSWEQVAGPAVVLTGADEVSASFVPDEFGEYVFGLVVNNGLYDSRPDTVRIALGNLAPVAEAGDNQVIEDPCQVVTVDGIGSYDPDGDSITYRWMQTRGEEVALSDPNSQVVTFVPGQYGLYAFTLVVNDGMYMSQGDTVNVLVTGGNGLPVADAGSSRYAGIEPVVLDGTSSFDPEPIGSLEYQWYQISGPELVMTDANTATPTVSGWVQTQEIQTYEFWLVVNNGEGWSTPDTTKVIIVPYWGANGLALENTDGFDPDKPTIVYFSGGNCYTGGGAKFDFRFGDWKPKANILRSTGYDSSYGSNAGLILAYLSKHAPEYDKSLQLTGSSTGGMPAIDTARMLNLVYRDNRYAVNRISFFDVACRSDADYAQDVNELVTNRMDGEQFWVDNYMVYMGQIPNALNVRISWDNHGLADSWYRCSATCEDHNMWNGGVVAGYFWSVAGPGKNLQLATGNLPYYFEWHGPSDLRGAMGFYDEGTYPGRLPEPVTLAAWSAEDNADEIILSCASSENAVRYQLLMGPDAQHVDYVVCETNEPPLSVIESLPFEETWWMVKVWDAYGSSIYADPVRAGDIAVRPMVENITRGSRYAGIQDAIDRSVDGDIIVVHEGINREIIDFKGKNIVLRSVDPEDEAVVAATIIDGFRQDSAVTFAGTEDSRCVLSGLTIRNGYQRTYGGGIAGNGTMATLSRCVVADNEAEEGGGIDNFDGLIEKCTIAGNTAYCGGGLKDCDGHITGSVIMDNQAVEWGGGLLWCAAAIDDCAIKGNRANIGAGMCYCGGSIQGCVISGNWAMQLGGGVQWSDTAIRNCTIAGNKAMAGAGISICAGVIENCIVYDNRSQTPAIIDSPTPAYSCLQEPAYEGGNIMCDPCFVDSGHWDANGTPGDANDDFWVDGDYHLKSEGWRWDSVRGVWTWDDVTSRCIDAGCPSTALGDEPLTLDVDPENEFGVNLRVDMGAYGGTGEASMGPRGWGLACDVNNDGVVDAEDLGLMAQEWLESEGACDFDRDSNVGSMDFAILGTEWLKEAMWRD
jgi:hypothetical protein